MGSIDLPFGFKYSPASRIIYVHSGKRKPDRGSHNKAGVQAALEGYQRIGQD